MKSNLRRIRVARGLLVLALAVGSLGLGALPAQAASLQACDEDGSISVRACVTQNYTARVDGSYRYVAVSSYQGKVKVPSHRVV